MAVLRNAVSDYVLREGLVVGAQANEFVRDEGRRYMATDIRCGECGAAEGDRCEGARFCPLRMRTAVELAREGQLVSRGPAKVVTECPDCERTDFGGRRLACANPAHQCQRRDRSGKQCQWAVLPGTLHCPSHTNQVKPGRKSALTDEKVAEAIKTHDSGQIWAVIAQRLGVSQQNLAVRVKRYRAKQRADSE